MVQKIKNHAIFLLVTIVTLIIVILLVSIQLLNPKSNKLVGFPTLQKEINIIGNNPNIKNEKNFKQLVSNANSLTNNNLERKEKLNILKQMHNNAINAYAVTNDPKLYTFQNDLITFINANYPENGQIDSAQCMDPTCAQKPVPAEIKNLIDEISSSNIQDDIKNDVAKELLNFSYINDDHAYEKTADFMFVAQDIKTTKEFVDSGNSEKWSNIIIDYLQTNYPNEYSQFQNP